MSASAEQHPSDGLPILPFPDAAAFEAWMDASAGESGGIWLKIAKKASGLPTVTHDEAIDVALCFGWIDGQARSYDETYHLQRFVPRRPRSTWSQINTERVERLIAAQRMRPAGLAEVERAKADGRWEAAYHSPGRIEVPADLQAFLDANPEAAAFFASLDSTNRYAILYRLQTAKRPQTRARRFEQYTRMLVAGETLHPQRRRRPQDR